MFVMMEDELVLPGMEMRSPSPNPIGCFSPPPLPQMGHMRYRSPSPTSGIPAGYLFRQRMALQERQEQFQLQAQLEHRQQQQQGKKNNQPIKQPQQLHQQQQQQQHHHQQQQQQQQQHQVILNPKNGGRYRKILKRITQSAHGSNAGFLKTQIRPVNHYK